MPTRSKCCWRGQNTLDIKYLDYVYFWTEFGLENGNLQIRGLEFEAFLSFSTLPSQIYKIYKNSF